MEIDGCTLDEHMMRKSLPVLSILQIPRLVSNSHASDPRDLLFGVVALYKGVPMIRANRNEVESSSEESSLEEDSSSEEESASAIGTSPVEASTLAEMDAPAWEGYTSEESFSSRDDSSQASTDVNAPSQELFPDYSISVQHFL